MNGQAEGEATDHSTAPIRSGRPHGSCGISVLRGYFDCRRSVLAARPTGTAWRIARTKGQSAAGLDHDRICTVVHCGGGFFQRHHSNRRHRPDGAAHRGRRPTGCVRRAHAMAAPLRMVLDADRRTPHARRPYRCTVCPGQPRRLFPRHRAWPRVDALRRSGPGVDTHADRYSRQSRLRGRAALGLCRRRRRSAVSDRLGRPRRDHPRQGLRAPFASPSAGFRRGDDRFCRRETRSTYRQEMLALTRESTP